MARREAISANQPAVRRLAHYHIAHPPPHRGGGYMAALVPVLGGILNRELTVKINNCGFKINNCGFNPQLLIFFQQLFVCLLTPYGLF